MRSVTQFTHMRTRSGRSHEKTRNSPSEKQHTRWKLYFLVIISDCLYSASSRKPTRAAPDLTRPTQDQNRTEPSSNVCEIEEKKVYGTRVAECKEVGCFSEGSKTQQAIDKGRQKARIVARLATKRPYRSSNKNPMWMQIDSVSSHTVQFYRTNIQTAYTTHIIQCTWFYSYTMEPAIFRGGAI